MTGKVLMLHFIILSVPGCTHMPLAFMCGYFGLISIKNHKVSWPIRMQSDNVVYGCMSYLMHCITTPSPTPSVLNILNLLGNSHKTTVSSSTLYSRRVYSLSLPNGGNYFLWCMIFCVSVHLYKGLSKPWDTTKGRLDTRLFTPTTMQK